MRLDDKQEQAIANAKQAIDGNGHAYIITESVSELMDLFNLSQADKQAYRDRALSGDYKNMKKASIDMVLLLADEFKKD